MGFITGTTQLDHFLVNCSACKEQVNIKFYHCEKRLSCFEYTCANCGNYGVLKLNKSKIELINKL